MTLERKGIPPLTNNTLLINYYSLDSIIQEKKKKRRELLNMKCIYKIVTYNELWSIGLAWLVDLRHKYIEDGWCPSFEPHWEIRVKKKKKEKKENERNIWKAATWSCLLLKPLLFSSGGEALYILLRRPRNLVWRPWATIFPVFFFLISTLTTPIAFPTRKTFASISISSWIDKNNTSYKGN